MGPQRTQKNLTVMFTDISGFTRHTETISREELMKRLDTHNELLMPIVAHFDGRIIKTIGDSFLITFESPTNAVQCGLVMQHTLARFNAGKPAGDQIHIKVSINSGEVTVTESDVFGDPVNVAAKIEKATSPGDIYFTEAVFLAMNKAEVPTAFVKTFRPRGAESQEIKLYKVAMDEGDERYKKIIQHTHIDPEKVKTRVRELSDVAEKEVARYQDTLSALLASQGKSSRNMIVAVIAAVLVLGVVIVVAMTQLGGKDPAADPAAQLARDVRAYLASKRAVEARNVVDAYIRQRGADRTSEELLAEIRGLEVGEVAALAASLLVKGEPENAKAEIVKFFGAKAAEGEAATLLAQAEAWLKARQFLARGQAAETLAALEEAFGETQPAAEIGHLRERAGALIEARRLLAGAGMDTVRVIGLIEKAFGGDVNNEAALPLLEQALARELFRVAKEGGYERGFAEFEAYRKRFRQMPDWQLVSISMLMGYVWYVGVNDRHGRMIAEREYWERWHQVNNYVQDKPELLYRWGTLRFLIDRKNNQIVANGLDSWRKAIAQDPSLIEKHAAIWKMYEVPLDEERAACGRDLKSALEFSLCLSRGPVSDAREMIKQLYYDELRPKLLAFANSREDGVDSQRLNSWVILAERGDAALVQDRPGLFRRLFEDFVFGVELERAQMAHFFPLPMDAQEYGEYRRKLEDELAQAAKREGRYSTYPAGHEKVSGMLADLKQAQPAHTQAYGG